MTGNPLLDKLTDLIFVSYGLNGTLTIIVIVLIYLLFHPDTFKKWASMIAWVGSRIWKSWEYFAIKTEIESDINAFVNRLEARTKIRFPRIKISWAGKNKDEEIVWEDSEAIIVMRDRKYRKKNVVHAVYFFTSEAMLRKSKMHLSKSQKTSVDLYATLKILKAESAASVQQFMTDYFTPSINANGDIRKYTSQYTSIDRGGIFFSVLIQELSSLGNKVFLEKPTQEVMNEVSNLITFLENFCNRLTGSNLVNDTFIGRYTRCSIKVVSSASVRESGNVFPHKKRIINAINNRLENIYLIGRSDEGNKAYMEEVVDSVLDEVPHIERVSQTVFTNQINIKGLFRPALTCLIQLHNPTAVKYIFTPEDTAISETVIEE